MCRGYTTRPQIRRLRQCSRMIPTTCATIGADSRLLSYLGVVQPSVATPVRLHKMARTDLAARDMASGVMAVECPSVLSPERTSVPPTRTRCQAPFERHNAPGSELAAHPEQRDQELRRPDTTTSSELAAAEQLSPAKSAGVVAETPRRLRRFGRTTPETRCVVPLVQARCNVTKGRTRYLRSRSRNLHRAQPDSAQQSRPRTRIGCAPARAPAVGRRRWKTGRR